MQNMSRTMKEAIRSTYQAPLAKLEILNKDGSKAGEILDVIDVNLGVFSSRDILRSLRVSVDNKDGQYTPDPDLFDKNFLWYNKKMKLYYGFNTSQPDGYLELLDNGVNGSTLRLDSMTVRSLEMKIWLDPFIDGTENWRYLLDARSGLTNGYIANKGWGTGWTKMKIDGVDAPLSVASIPKGQWVNLYLEAASTFTDDVNIFSNYPNSETSFGKIKEIRVYSAPRTDQQVTGNLNKKISLNDADLVAVFDFEQGENLQSLKGSQKVTIYKSFFQWVKIQKEEWLPQGVFNIGYIRTEVDPDGTTLELEGQDCIEDLHEDQFDDVYKAETTFTESANYALTPAGVATASTVTTAGDDVQRQSKIHYAETFATINGLKTAAENEAGSDPGNMVNQNIYPDYQHNWDTQPFATVTTTVNSNTSGILNVTSTGVDPSFNMVAVGSFDPNVYRWIEIRYKILNGISTSWEIFFTNDRYTGANGAQGKWGLPSLIADGQWHVAKVDMWTHPDWKLYGNIRGWRYDWATASGVNMELDYIALRKDDDQAAVTDWVYEYTPKEAETVSQIEAEIFVDLQDLIEVQEVKLHFSDGAELMDGIYTSPDNAAWTNHPSSPAWPSFTRYIKFKVRKTTANEDGSWRLGVSEVQIVVDADSPAINAIDGSFDTSWRPKASDLNPWFQIDMGAAKSINAIYLSWGKNSFDFWNRVKYFIEHSTNGSTWTRLSDLNGYDETVSRYGDVEHVFNAISPRYIRITLRGVDGIAILRNVRIQSITATKTIRDMMTEILDGTTFSGKYQLPYTRRYIERKMADIGDEKAKFLRSLARSAGWEVNTDENGVYKAYVRNVNPVDYAWDFTPETDNIFSFGVTLSYDIKNVIVVTYESSDKKAIVGRAIDDNPLSPTSIYNLGRRVKHYSGESYNSQEICDKVAQERLFERTRQKHHTSLPITGHPGIQVDDVVILTVDEANVIQGYYLVTGYETTFKADNGEFDTRINISQI